MNMECEYIVVGSGPCGAQAAQTLTEAGKNVTMLDVGFTDEIYNSIVPDDDFINLRKNDPSQYRYFLGDHFETIPVTELKVGAQLTPPRKHLIRGVEKYIPLSSETFLPMESLAYGGLGAGWGLGCFVYSDSELKKAGLDPEKFKKSYQVISDRIGISKGIDDVVEYSTRHLRNILPPLKMDNATNKLYEKYLKKKEKFAKKNIFIGTPPVAMLSEDYKGRKKTEYQDMDFYSDKGWYAYRAWMTIEELKKHSNFRYVDKTLVLSFKEDNEKVIVSAKQIDTNEVCSYTCKRFVLATGPLGSARIVMRSSEGKIRRLPLLCNPYTYMPCIQLRMLGKPLDRFKSSMVQALMIYDKGLANDDVVSVSLYTYRSLLLNKLIKEAPIDLSGGRIIMQYLQSAFMIAGIHHPDNYSSEKFLELVNDVSSYTGDRLAAHYALSEIEQKTIVTNEKEIKKSLRNLGCYPVMRMDPGYGSSIHYAGTLPLSSNVNDLGSTSPEGKLNGSKNVFIADGSSFKYLPAKGITLSIMANAHIVAQNAMNSDE